MQDSQMSHRNADSYLAVVPNNQIVILSTNQSETHIEDFPWSDLHSMGQLASHGRHDLRYCGV